MEFIVNKERNRKRQIHNFLVQQMHFPIIYQTLQTTNRNKNELCETVKLTSFPKPTILIRCNLQVCLSVSICVFPVFLIPDLLMF